MNANALNDGIIFNSEFNQHKDGRTFEFDYSEAVLRDRGYLSTKEHSSSCMF